ncbi:hypothetical protein DCAR_0415201 [Daucus carota subsp. sativus]|uniref:Uncharacterized protein n=1 Tax=Daucus carota subsp. sativus TaxID=79200 RepID=A0A165A8L4_DAUCS|nr:PREDICTED: peptidyl-prolyl cis-trans isomerase-like [Daucus carota subsp. sativus]WOG95872.1 hypothetical protein DCAR_0415201 [Daucus carota subsp. sativus]
MGNPKSILDAKDVKNPRVFFDIEIDGVHAGRIVIELFADISPKAVEKFWALYDGQNGGPWARYTDYSSTIRDVYFFEAGPNFYLRLSKTWGVVSGKVLDGVDVVKALESVRVIYRYGRKGMVLRTTIEPVIRVTCGQLSDQSLKYHNLKNYGPRYHNLIKGSNVPHEYVYRSGQGKDHKRRSVFGLSCRYSSLGVVDLLNRMLESKAFMAFIFGGEN